MLGPIFPATNLFTKFLALAIVDFYIQPFYNPNNPSHTQYDFIIIGGGTAGAIVASRLSENPAFNVLLIEAGGASGNYYSEIPYYSQGFGFIPTPLTHDYVSTYQAHACGSTGGFCDLASGNGLGGGSTHNAMYYVRGSPHDYHEWVHKYGCYGWSYEDVLPLFKSIEKRTMFDDAKLGIGVSRFVIYPPIQNILLEYLQDAGFRTGNFNKGNQDKIGSPEYAIWRGARSSSWNGYLKRIIQRPNLKTITFSQVTKINFDANKRAVSVSHTRYGIPMLASVSKEVILSAGSIASAQLLQVSGVGDFNHLKSVGVTSLVKNLPGVGKGFQDHLIVPFIGLSFSDINVAGAPTIFDIAQYFKNKTGPLTIPLGAITGFITDAKYSQKVRYFDQASNHYTQAINHNDTKTMLYVFIDTNDQVIIAALSMINPKSRGYVKIVSPDPGVDPLINPAYFTDAQDLEILIRSMKHFIKTMKRSPVLKKYGIKIITASLPGCGVWNGESFNSEAFVKCLIRMNSHTIYHPVSTCRMGRRSNRKAVVDTTLRLIGVQNVRVIDASVMPQITRGNTNAPTSMIAERGARFIMRKYANKL